MTYLLTLIIFYFRVGDIERHNDNMINNQFEEIIKTTDTSGKFIRKLSNMGFYWKVLSRH